MILNTLSSLNRPVAVSHIEMQRAVDLNEHLKSIHVEVVGCTETPCKYEHVYQNETLCAIQYPMHCACVVYTHLQRILLVRVQRLWHTPLTVI